MKRWIMSKKPVIVSNTLIRTQPLTETSTRNFPGGKKQPAHRADNLAAIYELNVWKCESLNL
jgi:hypothetical protein